MPAGMLLAALVSLACAAPASADHPAGPPAQSDLPPPPAEPSPGPSISGTAMDGQTLTANLGTWDSDTELTSDWLRCDTAGANCVLTHDTDGSYTLAPADVGSTIVLRVRGTDPPPLVGGFRDADSAPTAEVDAISPQNTALPTFTGTERDGQVLSGDPGSWTGTPTIGFTYQWQRCSPACSDIAGATSIDYTLQAADVGNRVLLLVTGTRSENAADTSTTPSAQSGEIQAIPTNNVSAPKINGTVRQGNLLSAAPGTWNGTSPLTFTYVWQRCAVTCTQVATGGVYRVAAADVGKRLKLTVTATGPGGSDTASSPLSAIVAKLPTGSGGGNRTVLRKLSPFPVVAIGGRVRGRGVFVSQLRVFRAPTGATVTVTCKGRDCPFKRARRTIRRRSGLRLKSLEKRLRRGTVIVIVVRKGNAIGKYTRLRIRKGAPPARIDRCIRPGAVRPSACPG